MNPLNFMCYFSTGMIIANNNVFIKVVYKCADYMFLLLYIVLLVLIRMFDITSGYWGYATLIMQPVAIAMIFGLATKKIVYNGKILELGIESFSFYLLHVPVAGIITFIFNRYDLWVLTLVRLLIIIGITEVFIHFYKIVGSKLKIDNYTNLLIGVK